MLGDLIESALDSVGIDKRTVSDWIGRKCRCEEWRDKLNALTYWAGRKNIDRQESTDMLRKIIDENY